MLRGRAKLKAIRLLRGNKPQKTYNTMPKEKWELGTRICQTCKLEYEGYPARMYCDDCRPANKVTVLQKKRFKRKHPFTGMTRAMRLAAGDCEIIDENGRSIWAFDLAQKYRKELAKRQNRDYRVED